MAEIPRVAVMASGDRASGGGGSTVNAFARDILEGEVELELGVVICNNPPGSVGVYNYIDEINSEFGLKGDNRIDVVHIGPDNHPGGPQKRGQTEEESSAICRLLEERNIDFVSMLGYMRMVTGELIETWGWRPEYAEDPEYGYRNGLYHPKARIINNHPSILPFTADTHGPGAHQRAIDLYKTGELTHSAMSWHLASEVVDGGPVVHEEPVAISDEDDSDSLANKVQAVEKDLTAQVIYKHLILRKQHLLAA